MARKHDASQRKGNTALLAAEDPRSLYEGLRILARIIARARLRSSQLKGKKSNKHGERKTQ